MATLFRRKNEGQVSTGQVLLKALVIHLGAFFASLGGVGLFLFGIIDSSFFFLPLGIDILLVGLTARHHERMFYYAGMCAAGSVLGVLTTDWVSRRGGEAGLEGHVSGKRLRYVQGQVKKRGGWALAVASVMPPGFPFTPVIIVAAALKYPRPKLVAIVAIFRLVRFSIEGWLAIHYGRGILRMAERPVVQRVIFGLVIVSIVGSAWSIYGWVRRSKGAAK